MPREIWLNRIEKANVIVVGGGNTQYLMDKIVENGFDKDLPEFLKEKVYVGISAGSIVMAKTLWCDSEFLFGDETGKVSRGLGYININFRPHLNSSYYPKVREEYLDEIFKDKTDDEIYVLDDNSALKIIDNKIEIVSEGTYKIYNRGLRKTSNFER